METNYKRKIMRLANQIAGSTTYGRSISLVKAWQLYRLQKALEAGIVKFSYKRINGLVCTTTGTLKGLDTTLESTGHKSNKVMVYYDLNAKNFRSFRIENLISTY